MVKVIHKMNPDLARKWTPTADTLPPEGVLVETKIDDGRECRNEGKLRRYDNLWFLPGRFVYVYYEPTHWRTTK